MDNRNTLKELGELGLQCTERHVRGRGVWRDLLRGVWKSWWFATAVACLVGLLVDFGICTAKEEFACNQAVIESALLILGLLILLVVNLESFYRAREEKFVRVERISHALTALPQANASNWAGLRLYDSQLPSILFTFRHGEWIPVPTNLIMQGDIIALEGDSLAPIRIELFDPQHKIQLEQGERVSKETLERLTGKQSSGNNNLPAAERELMEASGSKGMFLFRVLETPLVKRVESFLQDEDKNATPRSVPRLLSRQRILVERYVKFAVLGFWLVSLTANVFQLVFVEGTYQWPHLLLARPIYAVLACLPLLVPVWEQFLELWGTAKLLALNEKLQGLKASVSRISARVDKDERRQLKDQIGNRAQRDVLTQRVASIFFRLLLDKRESFLPTTYSEGCNLSPFRMANLLGNPLKCDRILETLASTNVLCCLDEQTVLAPTPSVEEVTLLGGERRAIVLDLCDGPGGAVTFEDPGWKSHASSLKPLGLACALGTSPRILEASDACSPTKTSQATADPLQNYRQLLALINDRATPTQFAGLAKVIGFRSVDLRHYVPCHVFRILDSPEQPLPVPKSVASWAFHRGQSQMVCLVLEEDNGRALIQRKRKKRSGQKRHKLPSPADVSQDNVDSAPEELTHSSHQHESHHHHHHHHHYHHQTNRTHHRRSHRHSYSMKRRFSLHDVQEEADESEGLQSEGQDQQFEGTTGEDRLRKRASAPSSPSLEDLKERPGPLQHPVEPLPPQDEQQHESSSHPHHSYHHHHHHHHGSSSTKRSPKRPKHKRRHTGAVSEGYLTLHSRETKRNLHLICFGDPTMVLSCCAEYWSGDAIWPLRSEDRESMISINQRWAKEEFDGTAFSYTPIPSQFAYLFPPLPKGNSHKTCPTNIYLKQKPQPQEAPDQHDIESQQPPKTQDDPKRTASETTDFDSKQAKQHHHKQASGRFSALRAARVAGQGLRGKELEQMRNALLKELIPAQVFTGMVGSREQPRPSLQGLIEDLHAAGVRFVYFSPRNPRRSLVLADKMGLETNWNTAISLKAHDPPASSTSLEGGSAMASQKQFQELCTHWDEKAKLPHGIDEIRNHLEEVDDVPLRVSTFTDSTPLSSRDMISIHQEYGSSVTAVGTGLRAENSPSFKQANLAISLQSKVFIRTKTKRVRPSMAPDPSGIRDMRMFPSSFREKEGENEVAIPALLQLELSATLTSLHASLVVDSDASLSIVGDLIGEARLLMSNYRQAVLMILAGHFVLATTCTFSYFFVLPDALNGIDITWLLWVQVPLLGLPFISKRFRRSMMTEIPSKNEPYYERYLATVTKRYVWHTAVRLLPTSIVLVFLYMVVVVDLSPDPDAAWSAVFWNQESPTYSISELREEGQVARASLMFALVWFLVIHAMTYATRYDSLWREPPTNFHWWVAVVVVLVLQIAYNEAFLAIVHNSLSADQTLVWLTAPSKVYWILFALWPFPIILTAELCKWQNRIGLQLFQKRLRVVFETRLGMHSPK